MNDKILLVKSITLLYKESLLEDYKDNNSKDLVATLVQQISLPSINLGVSSENEVLKELKEIAVDMLKDKPGTEYDPSLILQRLNLIPYVDDKTCRALEEGLKDVDNSSAIRRSVTILRNNITNYFREKQIDELLSKKAAQFKFKRDEIKDINRFIEESLTELEALQLTSTSKDPAVISEVDIGDENSTIPVFNIIHENKGGDNILKTGWQALNRMTQGGLRRGEFVTVGALQHKYKTGFTLSLFKQLALYNKPTSIKKPLLLRISFEDELKLNLQYLYENLKYNENPTSSFILPEVSSEEMSKYVKESLQVNGFHIKMMRVDPSQWTYRDVFNKITQLEAEGYEIYVLMLDYLAHIPTIGCNTSGAVGTDIRDLFRRIRNMCSPRNITVITPHQLSTEAKALARTGIPQENFVKEISEKGYYSGSRQLDQEIDLELYIHLVKDRKDIYLSVQRGKHRIPTIIDEDDKYFLLKFPYKMPIPDDIYGKDSSYKKIGQSEGTDELFSI